MVMSEMDKPWSFTSHQITPYYNASSPSIRSLSHISLSPNLPSITHRMSGNKQINCNSPNTVRTMNNLNYQSQPSSGHVSGNISGLTTGITTGVTTGVGTKELDTIQSVSRSVSNVS